MQIVDLNHKNGSQCNYVIRYFHVLVVQPCECKFDIDLIVLEERVVTSVDMIIMDDILWEKKGSTIPKVNGKYTRAKTRSRSNVTILGAQSSTYHYSSYGVEIQVYDYIL